MTFLISPVFCVTSFIGDDLIPINMINMIKLADLLIDIYLTYVNGCGAPGLIQIREYYLNVLLYLNVRILFVIH